MPNVTNRGIKAKAQAHDEVGIALPEAEPTVRELFDQLVDKARLVDVQGQSYANILAVVDEYEASLKAEAKTRRVLEAAQATVLTEDDLTGKNAELRKLGQLKALYAAPEWVEAQIAYDEAHTEAKAAEMMGGLLKAWLAGR